MLTSKLMSKAYKEVLKDCKHLLSQLETEHTPTSELKKGSGVGTLKTRDHQRLVDQMKA